MRFLLGAFLLLANVAFAQTSGPDSIPIIDVLQIKYEVPKPSPEENVKNFTMLAPTEWEVLRNVGNYEILMQPKIKATPTPDMPIGVDPNLAVAVLRNPIPIDEKGLNAYAATIEAELNKVVEGGGARPIGASVYHKSIVDLPNKHIGYLFYTQGKLNNLNTRQAILVMSTDVVSYRVILTDVETNFDKTLEKMYPIMTSITLNGFPPVRDNALAMFLPWILGVGFVLIVFAFIRHSMIRRSQNIIASIETDDGPAKNEDFEDQYSAPNPSSIPNTSASSVANSSRPAKSSRTAESLRDKSEYPDD